MKENETAGDRVRARIRRNRAEQGMLALSGAFGPVREAWPPEISLEEMTGLSSERLHAIETAIRAMPPAEDDFLDLYDDGQMINPPAEASWLSDKNEPVPLRRSGAL